MTTSSLLQSAAAIGAALATNAIRRAAATMVGYLAAGLLLAVSLCFLTFSAYHAIAQSAGEIFAALIIGCGYFVLSLMVLLVLGFRSR
jgi:hypothetical protein